MIHFLPGYSSTYVRPPHSIYHVCHASHSCPYLCLRLCGNLDIFDLCSYLILFCCCCSHYCWQKESNTPNHCVVSLLHSSTMWALIVAIMSVLRIIINPILFSIHSLYFMQLTILVQFLSQCLLMIDYCLLLYYLKQYSYFQSNLNFILHYLSVFI